MNEAAESFAHTDALPNGWTYAALGDVCKTTSGGTPSRKNADYFTGHIPWVKSGELPDGLVTEVEERITEAAIANSSAKLFPAGTLLIALYGATVGKLGILKEDATTNQAVCAIFPSKDLDAKYLFWYLRFVRPDLVAQAVGGAQPNISQGILRELLVPVAPLDQQKHIVAEIEKQFSRLDEAVANLKRVRANLKRYKAAVLKSAVEGRLVETEAELASREGRDYETGEQLLQRILETRRSQWQGKRKYKEPAAPDTTDLPELPEGWGWATLEQLCRTFVDSAHRTPKYGETGNPAIGPRDIVDGDLRLVSARLVDGDEYAIQTKRHIPQAGDIVYSRELSLGWGAIVPENAKLCLSQGMCLFRPEDMVVLSYFMYSLNGPEVRRQAIRGSTGSAHPHLNLGDIKAFVFSLPPQSEQHRIVAEVDRRLSLLRETEAQVDASLRRAERLRQSILACAFSGGFTSCESADHRAA